MDCQIPSALRSSRPQRKDAGLPGRHIQIQPASLQVVAVPLVPSRAELILQLPFLAGEIRKRQPNKTLALVGGIVDGGHERFALRSLPAENQEAIVRRVPFPGRGAFKQLPLAVANARLTKHGKQAVVKLFQLLIDGFLRASNEVGRDSFPAALELTLMEEAQARGQKRDDSRGLMNFRGARRR